MGYSFFRFKTIRGSKQVLFPLIFFTALIQAQVGLKHYSASDGLAHDVTYNIYQDTKGYIWICTDDGLSKFDGNQFKNYRIENGLTSSYIMDIKELANGTFAISTWGGGLHFLENDTIVKKPIFKDFNMKVENLTVANEKIYSSSGSSFFLYDLNKENLLKQVFLDKKGLAPYNQDNEYIKLITVSKVANQLFVHDRAAYQKDLKGIFRLNPNGEIENTFKYLKNKAVSAILAIDNEHYIFGIDNTLSIGTKAAQVTNYKVDKLDISHRMIKIVKDPRNETSFFLLARNKNGFKRLYRFDTALGVSEDLISKLGLNATVSDVIFDNEGNLWISTFGNGVFCYIDHTTKLQTILEGKYIEQITGHNGKVYALSPSKLFEIKDEKIFKSYDINGFAKSMSSSKDTLFISILNGISNQSFQDIKFVGGRFYKESKFGPIQQTDTLFFNEIPIYSGNEIVINATTDTEDNLEFYTSKGKWNYELETSNFYYDTIFPLNKEPFRIHDVKRKRDSTFYLTDRGLYFAKNTSQGSTEELYRIFDRSTNDLYIDDQLFLATQNGLAVIGDEEILNFSKSSGISSLAINSIYEHNNKLWLGGDNGISIVDKESLRKSSPPKMEIVQNGAFFTYKIISYEDADISTMYRLNSGPWIGLNGLDNTIDFSDYSFGNHSIEFRSRKHNSDWGEAKIYFFSLIPPWYKNSWYLTGIIIVSLSLLIVGFIRRLQVITNRNKAFRSEMDKRLQAEKELGEVRNTIARDFHDDLGNKLASISLLSDLLSKRVSAKNSNLMKSIKEDADHLYKGTKDFIFSLQEKSNYLDEVSIYLSDFAEDYLYQFGISFEMESNIKKGIKLPYYWSKQIIFIFKEAITNTVKHSDAKNTYMSFHCKEGNLSIEFKDDGCGFYLDEVTMNGLTNMKTRADKIKCELVLHTQKNKGTSIIFNGKLPQKGSASG